MCKHFNLKLINKMLIYPLFYHLTKCCYLVLMFYITCTQKEISNIQDIDYRKSSGIGTTIQRVGLLKIGVVLCVILLLIRYYSEKKTEENQPSFGAEGIRTQGLDALELTSSQPTNTSQHHRMLHHWKLHVLYQSGRHRGNLNLEKNEKK